MIETIDDLPTKSEEKSLEITVSKWIMTQLLDHSIDIFKQDESTLKNEFGNILTIRSSNEDVQEILHNLFYDIMNIEFNL